MQLIEQSEFADTPESFTFLAMSEGGEEITLAYSFDKWTDGVCDAQSTLELVESMTGNGEESVALTTDEVKQADKLAESVLASLISKGDLSLCTPPVSRPFLSGSDDYSIE